MKLKTAFLPALALALALPALTPHAQAQSVEGAPEYIDYQGMVFDGTTTDKPLGSTGTGTIPDPYVAAPKNYTMEFRIYDKQSAGTLIWAETQTVTVSLGAFAVRLGSGAPISGLSPTPTQTSIAEAFDDKDRYLELSVIVPPAITGTAITPRLAFQSSPFSFVAQRAVLADTATEALSVSGVVTATAESTFAGGTFAGGTFAGGTFGSVGDPATFVGNGVGLTGFTASQIPDLDASKITEGVLGIPQIPDLDAGKITSGILPVARGGTGSETKNFVDLTTEQTPITGTKGFYNGNGGVLLGSGGANSAPLIVEDGFEVGNTGIYVGVYVRESVQVDGRLDVNGAVTCLSLTQTSDARTKNVERISDSAEDLATLSRIEVTDYKWKDPHVGNNRAQKKVIAQQVEKFYPQAIGQITGVIPDIHQKATVKDGWILLATDLKKGERVRLISGKEKGIHEVLEVAKGQFRTDFKPAGEQVFVFGREVNDFRTVDYGAISMLNVSATQQIKKEKDAEVKALQEENSALRASLAAQEKRLAALEAKDKARDAKFARFEKLLDATPDLQPVTTVLSR